MYGRLPDPRFETATLPISAPVDPTLMRVDTRRRQHVLAWIAIVGLIVVSVLVLVGAPSAPPPARNVWKWVHAPEEIGLGAGFGLAVMAAKVVATSRLRVMTRAVFCALVAVLIGVLVGVGVHETGVREHSQASVNRASQG